MQQEQARKDQERLVVMQRAKAEWIAEQKRAINDREKAHDKVRKQEEEKEKLR